MVTPRTLGAVPEGPLDIPVVFLHLAKLLVPLHGLEVVGLSLTVVLFTLLPQQVEEVDLYPHLLSSPHMPFVPLNDGQ